MYHIWEALYKQFSPSYLIPYLFKINHSVKNQSVEQGLQKTSIIEPENIRETPENAVQPYGPHGIYLSRNISARRSCPRQIKPGLDCISSLAIPSRRLTEANSNPF